LQEVAMPSARKTRIYLGKNCFFMSLIFAAGFAESHS
jgi:hypothetical protein